MSKPPRRPAPNCGRRKVLYLDQNAWIDLAKGAWNKVEFPTEHAALTLLIRALEADTVVVPLSFTNFYETQKIDDPVRRAHLANVQTTISRGKVLRGRRRILEVGLLRRIAQDTAIALEPEPDEWFLSDLWFEMVGEEGDEALADLPDVVRQYTRRNPQEALFEILVGRDDAYRKEGVRRYSASSADLLARLTTDRRRVAGEAFAMRLRVYSARLLIDEMNYILGLGRRHGLSWRTISDLGGKLAKSLVADVPVLNAERQLAVRLEDQQRELTENDLRDMLAFATALPLVDVLVGEKPFVNLSRQARLDVEYNTVLLTSVRDLSPEVLGQRDVGASDVPRE